MKNHLVKITLSSFLVILFPQSGKSLDSLRYSISLDYYRDFSDTYGGGYLFASELGIDYSWFGACISFGHFQSHSIFIYSINIEEINKSIDIKFDEVTIMKTGSLSLKLIPIQNKLITTDLLLGLTVGYAKNSRFNSVDYSYSLSDEKFNYLYKDYKLFTRTHFGYHIGFDVSFQVTDKFSLQIKTRIQDLNYSGTFFFVGGGLCFRL